MQKRIFISSLLVMFLSVTYAQKQISEGTFVYIISITSTGSDAPVSNPLNGAVLTQYVTLSQSRSEMKSALGTESAVFNSRNGKGFILKEYSGQKLMITLNAENWKQKNQFYNNLKFSIDDEIKTIGTYRCKKGTAVTEDGKSFIVYYTPDITVSNTRYNNAFSQLPGLPVQYQVQSGNLVFTYTLSDIIYEPVASTRFEIPKSGYRVMTYEENQQLKRGE